MEVITDTAGFGSSGSEVDDRRAAQPTVAMTEKKRQPSVRDTFKPSL